MIDNFVKTYISVIYLFIISNKNWNSKNKNNKLSSCAILYNNIIIFPTITWNPTYISFDLDCLFRFLDIDIIYHSLENAQ